MKITELSQEVITLLKSKHPLIVFETFEEPRAISMIEQIGEVTQREILIWSFTDGMAKIGSQDPPMAINDPMGALIEIEKAKTNGWGKIFVMLDFDPYIRDDHPDVIRKLRDLSLSLLNSKKTVLFISPKFTIPPTLTKSIAIFDFPYPAPDEIEAIIVATALEGSVKIQIEEYRAALDSNGKTKGEIQQIKDRIAELSALGQKIETQWTENKSSIVDACKGLTALEVENIISRCVVRRDLNISFILSEKKQIMKKAGQEFIETDLNLSNVGGLENLKEYARRAGRMFSKEAQEFGIPTPRGVLLVGPPGVGKSLSAKAFSSEMKKPLIRLDLSAQKSKWVGESEGNLLKSLAVVHAIEPAILWIDEIDKTVARGHGQDMHEVSAGMLGILLTDMEEKPGLFFFATCNNPLNLPAELLSRFQKIFFVDIPTDEERAEIFAIQIRAINRDPAKINIPALVAKTAGYSGREIRNIVQEALSVAFYKGLPDINTDLISEQIGKVVPISIQKAEDINLMRSWAAKNAEPANVQVRRAPDASGPAVSARKIDI